MLGSNFPKFENNKTPRKKLLILSFLFSAHSVCLYYQTRTDFCSLSLKDIVMEKIDFRHRRKKTVSG